VSVFHLKSEGNRSTSVRVQRWAQWLWVNIKVNGATLIRVAYIPELVKRLRDVGPVFVYRSRSRSLNAERGI